MREKLNRLRRELAEVVAASMFDKPHKAEKALITAVELLGDIVGELEEGKS